MLSPDTEHYKTDRPVSREELSASTPVYKKPLISEDTFDTDLSDNDLNHGLFEVYNSDDGIDLTKCDSITIFHSEETKKQGENFLTMAYGKMRNFEAGLPVQNIINVTLAQGKGGDSVQMEIYQDSDFRNEWSVGVTAESEESVDELFDVIYSSDGRVMFYTREPLSVQTQVDGVYHDVAWDEDDTSEDKLTDEEVATAGLPLYIKYRTQSGSECAFTIPGNIPKQAEIRLLYYLQDQYIDGYDFTTFDPYAEVGFKMDIEPGMEDAISL